MARARAIGPAFAAFFALTARTAHANGRLPGANRILLSATEPNLIVVRTTYGILPSFDGGRTWSFLCEGVLGLPQTATLDPALALTATRALIAGIAPSPPGLDVSSDTGCSWTCVGGPLANQAIADLAVRPNAPDAVVALTSTFLSNNAGGSETSQVFESTDDGANWSSLGVSLDPSVLVTTVEVASSDPHRLYVSGTRNFGAARTASLFASEDDGTTWTESNVPVDPTDPQPVYVGGVDPTDASRLYIRSGAPSRLFVSADGGRTFQLALSFTGLMKGFALSADGSKIYAGGETDGLYVGDRATLTFAKVSAIHVQCLATRGDELWACADDTESGFLAGVSTDDGATFTAKLHLGSVSAPIACSASTSDFACGADAGGQECSGAPFTQLCANVGCTLDSGVAGVAADASSRPDAGRSSGRASSSSGCALAGASYDRAPGLVGLALALASALRRRRRS